MDIWQIIIQMRTVHCALGAFILSISLTSCFLETLTGGSGKTDLIPVIINNEYSLDVPSFMTKTTSLNDVASLQFQNLFKEAYVIVIDEDKQEFLDALVEAERYDSAVSLVANYADTQVQLISAGVNVTSRRDPKSVRINGLNAKITEMDAEVEGVEAPVTYFMTFLESREKLYMIMAWTIKNKKETHRETFEKMARTFRVVRAKPLASAENLQ
jgi:hypothetical protein